MKPGANSLVWGLCLVLAACAPREPEGRFLELVQVRPVNTSGVFLNEPLVFHFSESLDPTSILGSVVQIVAREDGSRARGDLRLSGNKLVFHPAPVLAADLSDGGYLPNTTYDVQLTGFPRLDCLRSQTGAPLRRSLSLEFRTVDPAAPQSGFVFEDSSLDVGLPVLLKEKLIEPGEPILLEGEEPLDPATLFAEDFVLKRQMKELQEPDKKRPPMSEPIPMRARLLDNRNRRAVRWGEGTTLIELQPLQRLEPGELYFLDTAEDLRLRDFGGHPVPVRAGKALRRGIQIEVARHALGAPGSYFEYTETFIDTELRSPEPAEPPHTSAMGELGVDGTLAWGTTGRAELRWPAAAGHGAEGFVELTETEARTDIQATRMRLGAGVRCLIGSEPGPIVLRAQGKLLIEGTLVRQTSGEPPAAPGPFVPVLGMPPEPAAPTDSAESLSDWLARARAARTHCLVIIAGGDLVISGGIEADCPVLLVAGGRLRVRGRGLRAPELVTLGEGGGRSLNYERLGGNPFADVARLELDTPTRNLLAVPLVFGARSSSIPPLGGAERWHASPRIGAYAGRSGPAGAFEPRYRVQFLGECEPDGGGPSEVLVDDPVLLVDCPTLRLELTIEVGPGEVWDPPWIDSVQVRWDSPK